MKKLFTVSFLVFAFCLLLSIRSQATHFAGADLTYKCIGGNDYLITLAFYRDCGGISMDSYIPATVNFKCGTNANFNFSAQLYLITGSPQEITRPCPLLPTKCNNGNYYGIQEYIMQATVTLAPCANWKISYTNSARNLVSTVPNNTSNNFYVMAILDNLHAACNSSPYFTNKPVSIVCAGQQFCYNHGAIDDNGDSLVYSFYSPMTTDSAYTVSYAFPYTYQNFLQSNPAIWLDSLTGDICFTPTAILTTITGIRVKEYRKINGNYMLIGMVHRDMQLKIDYCSNTLPVLSGMDTLNTHHYNINDTVYKMETCYEPNKLISFDINGFDADSINPTSSGSPHIFSIQWNNGIPQGNFQSFYNSTDSAYAHFNWLLQPSDISNLPKCFTATISDEACPYYGLQTYSYCITVRGMSVKLGSDTLICMGESVVFNAEADTTTQNYIWNLNGNSLSVPLTQNTFLFNSNQYSPGIYHLGIETNDGGTTVKCPGKDEAIITVVYQPNIQGSLKDTAFCQPDSIHYNAGQGSLFYWSNSSGTYFNNNQNAGINSSGEYFLTVDGGNNTRCIDRDTFFVVSIEKPQLGNDTCLWNSGTGPYLTLQAIPANQDLSVLWSDNSQLSQLAVFQSGVYSASFYHPLICSFVKCSDQIAVSVLDKSVFILSTKIGIDNLPLANESDSTGDRIICTHQKLKIFGPENTSDMLYNYSWWENNTFQTNLPVFIFKEKVPDNYSIKLEVGNGCSDSINIKTIPCPVIAYNVITPNEDKINDKFVFKGLENYPGSSLKIFNRWGKLVFMSEDYKNDWEGINMSDGVYFWILRINNDEKTILKGNLTIMRN